MSYLGNRLYTMSPKYSMFPKPLYFPLWAVAKISFTSKRGFFDWDVKIRPVVWWGLGQFYHCWAVITNTNSASVVIKVVLKIFNTPALYQFWYTSVLRFLGFRGNLRFRLPQNPRDRLWFWFRLWIFFSNGDLVLVPVNSREVRLWFRLILRFQNGGWFRFRLSNLDYLVTWDFGFDS